MMKKQIVALTTCVLMGFSSITSYAYSAEVCQGDTHDAGDVIEFYNNLKSKEYNVTGRGYSGNNISIANKNDFINAKNYNVFYWSVHGRGSGNNASLNIIKGGSKQFRTFDAANKWKIRII